MRVSRSMQELYLQAKATRDSLVEETGVVPTVAEIAARLRCSPEEVMEAREAGHNYRPASLEALDEIRSQQLPAASGGYEGALDRHRLGELITTLSDEWTQRTIADELGVSQMHISRMLDRLLGRLRRGFED
jgi:RNA polymerase sigma-B factor